MMGVQENDTLSQLSLPPGFRFYPTDEELLVQYLCRKVAGHHFSLQIIAEIDLYKFDPWVLPSKAIFGEKEWYFFSPRDRKYPNGTRPNRVAGSGYWKATGTDKIITNEGRKVGIKKALVFYVGKAPKGTKTNWIMHEYRLLDSSRNNGGTKLDDWVLCRIYKKNSSAQKANPNGVVSSREYTQYSNGSSSSSSSHIDEVLESLPEIDDRCFMLPRVNSLRTMQHRQQEEEKVNLQNSFMDWSNPSSILNTVTEFQEAQTQGMVNFGGCNEVYVPSVSTVPEKKLTEEEVQSGARANRVENSGLFPGMGYSNSVDPFGFRYPVRFAKRQFRPEEKLITVPEELMLSGGKVADMEKYADFADRADPKLTAFDMLIMFFALEDPANSEWAPYLKMLPQDFTTPVFLGMSVESRHLPLSSRIHWEEQENSIQGSTERIQAVAPTISRERLMWAWHIVSTRCIYNENKHHPKLNNSEGDTTIVVPFVDMLNHVNNSQCMFAADKFKHQYFVKANRTVNEGQEAFVTYGGHNNARLWIDYGFRLPENMYTKVSIPIDTFFTLGKLVNLDLHDNHLKALYDAGFSTSLFATDDGPSYQILTNVKLLLMDKNQVLEWKSYAPKYNDSVDEDDDEQKQLQRNVHFWLERILTELRSGMERKKNSAPQFLHWIWDEDLAVIDNVIEKAHAVVDEIDNGANLQERQEDDEENNANNEAEEENNEAGENRENNDN